jgi:hypothetical protein
MNAVPADTRAPHLDLEDLIAEVTGQPIDDPAREHLTRCQHCRAEANRWDLVAAGVRGLVTATPEPAPPPALPRQTRPGPARPRKPLPRPALPRHPFPRPARPRLPAGPRRRAALAASAAAALVVVGGAGYAATAALTRPASGPVLTAVSGCSGVELTDGTLEQVNGTSLVIKTASGRPVTVTTAAATIVTVAGALRGDITDGAPVIAIGPSSAGTVAAASVTVGSLPGGKKGNLTPPTGWVVARGTAADASTAGFTVVTSGGTRVPVTTTGSTFVVQPRARLSQLQVGVTIVAVGHAGPDGTLSAAGVVQQPPGPMQVHFSLPIRHCSPALLADALATAVASGG